jgi:hypothetical protein
MIQLYKPNSRVTGAACGIWFSTTEQAFFFQIIKQASWNEKTKTGSFAENRTNQDKKVVVKFSVFEIGGFLNAIDNNTQLSKYHKTANHSTQIRFGPYMDKVDPSKQLGFSLSVIKEKKEDSVNKISFLIGITPDEARVIKEYLTFGINAILNAPREKEPAKEPIQEQEQQEAPNSPEPAF